MKLETRLRARLFSSLAHKTHPSHHTCLVSGVMGGMYGWRAPVSPYSYGPCCDGCVPPGPQGAGDPRDASDDSPRSSHSRCDENPRSRGRGDSENDQKRALL